MAFASLNWKDVKLQRLFKKKEAIWLWIKEDSEILSEISV